MEEQQITIKRGRGRPKIDNPKKYIKKEIKNKPTGRPRQQTDEQRANKKLNEYKALEKQYYINKGCFKAKNKYLINKYNITTEQLENIHYKPNINTQGELKQNYIILFEYVNLIKTNNILNKN